MGIGRTEALYSILARAWSPYLGERDGWVDIMRRQEAEREAKRKAKAMKAAKVADNRAKAKAARKSRKGNRG